MSLPAAAPPRASALRKRLLLAALAGLAALLLAEVAFRSVHYQLRGKRTFATVEGVLWLQQRLRERRVAGELDDPFGVHVLYREARERLRTPDGGAMRAELERVYTAQFGELAAAVVASGERLVVVDFLDGPSSRFGNFVAGVAAAHDVVHMDLRRELEAIAADARFLRPADGHLTRYANLRVAELLAEGLAPLAERRSSRQYSGEPRIVADGYDAYPGTGRRELIALQSDLGFCLVRNAQGFRNVADVEIPKTRPRVLCLGDSYTFGDHLNNQDTYPAALGRARPQWEVLNAGISGHTIADSARLFAERASRVAPDLVLLQVCENDLVELLSFVRAPLGRRPVATGVAADLERAFLAAVQQHIETSR